MAKAEWGKKHECPNCSCRFYDLLQPSPLTCPKCSFVFATDILHKVRKGKAGQVEDDEELDDEILDDDLMDAQEDTLLMSDDDDDDAPRGVAAKDEYAIEDDLALPDDETLADDDLDPELLVDNLDELEEDDEKKPDSK